MNWNVNLNCSETDMFGKTDKKSVEKQILLYLQRDNEFTDIVPAIMTANPDATDEEIIQHVCQKYNFDPKMDVPLVYNDYFIPLNDFGVTKTCRQFVLGRVHLLRPYYIQTTKYVTLTLPDKVWSDRFSFSLAMNDLFIYCAATAKKMCKERNYVPIRIVVDPKDLDFFNQGFAEAKSEYELDLETRRSERKRKEKQFDRKNRGLTPIDGRMPHKTVVLARELCQLTRILKLQIYQSKQYPTLLFIDYSPRN